VRRLFQRRGSAAANARSPRHELALVTVNYNTTTVLRPFFRNHPGEPVPEENFWTLWCKGRLTEADTPTIWLGATPSGIGFVARCVMARHTVARLVFGNQRCCILCNFDVRQSCASKTRDKIAGVTSVLQACFKPSTQAYKPTVPATGWS